MKQTHELLSFILGLLADEAPRNILADVGAHIRPEEIVLKMMKRLSNSYMASKRNFMKFLQQK